MGEKNRTRKDRFTIRLFSKETEILERKAKEYGANKTEYIRDMILFGIVRESKTDILSDEKFNKMLYELNRIGNNINQIAYNSNLKRSTGKKEIESLKEQYETLLGLYQDTFLFPDTEDDAENGNNEES